MDSLASDLITFIQYLLPGFLAAWIFYGFTSYQKPSQFERIIQALIFTVIIETGKTTLRYAGHVAGLMTIDRGWTTGEDLLVSVVLAIVTGFAFVTSANRNLLHGVVARLGMSRETSYPSEWFGEFSQKVRFVVLHLQDDRRVRGWPKEWPSQPDRGHFVLELPAWLEEDGTVIASPLAESLLIPAGGVRMVEFYVATWDEVSDEQEGIEPAPPGEDA